MRIIITGGAGGIGSILAETLRHEHDLIAVDSLRNGYLANLKIKNRKICRFENLDIRSNKFASLVDKTKPDIIIHLAAITSLADCESNPKECIDINVGGTMNVLEAAKKNNIKRIIFASTSAVYENSDCGPKGFREESDINPKLFYSLSKKISEEICSSYINNYGMEIPTLRLFNVFGPKQDIHRKSPPLINYLVKEFRNNRRPTLHSNGEQKRDYVHIEDVVKAFKICLDHPNANNNIFNISSNRVVSLKQIVKYVQEALDTDIKPVYISADKLWDKYPSLFYGKFPLKKQIVEEETNKFSLGDNTKAKNILGWKPNSDIEFLIKKTVSEINI